MAEAIRAGMENEKGESGKEEWARGRLNTQVEVGDTKYVMSTKEDECRGWK
jgi:hypothetical protein